MTTTSIIILLLLVIIPLWFSIPNRNFVNIKYEEIDERVRNLNPKQRISFQYKNIKVSLKKTESNIIIEPYTHKILELLIRILAFVFVAIVIWFFLSLLASILDYFNVGDRNLGNENASFINWQALLISSGKLWYIYFLIFYFSGKFLRKKFISRLFYYRFKHDWNEINSIY